MTIRVLATCSSGRGHLENTENELCTYRVPQNVEHHYFHKKAVLEAEPTSSYITFSVADKTYTEKYQDTGRIGTGKAKEALIMKSTFPVTSV